MNENDDRPQEGHDDEQSSKQTTLERFEESAVNTLCTDGGTPIEADEEPADDDDEADSESQTENIPSLTPSVRQFIKADRNNECELCSAQEDDETNLHIHHRTEQQNGGSHHPRNLLLLCQECHQRHHNNEPIEKKLPRNNKHRWTKETLATEEDRTDLTSEERGDENRQDTGESVIQVGTEEDPSNHTGGEDEPLPPRSKPNGADQEILSLLEEYGQLSTGELAVQTDYSKQYIRRQCWKLSGEQLVAPRTDNTWELKDRADESEIRVGLPDDPVAARRAGRDEVIRKMAASGMDQTRISEVTGLSRTTIEIAIDRARTLRIGNLEEEMVDLEMIGTRVSALLDLLEHAQTS